MLAGAMRDALAAASFGIFVRTNKKASGYALMNKRTRPMIGADVRGIGAPPFIGAPGSASTRFGRSVGQQRRPYISFRAAGITALPARRRLGASAPPPSIRARTHTRTARSSVACRRDARPDIISRPRRELQPRRAPRALLNPSIHFPVARYPHILCAFVGFYF